MNSLACHALRGKLEMLTGVLVSLAEINNAMDFFNESKKIDTHTW
jgi:hypothetical protein